MVPCPQSRMLERMDLTGSAVDLTEGVVYLTGRLLAGGVQSSDRTLALDRPHPDTPPRDHRNKQCD